MVTMTSTYMTNCVYNYSNGSGSMTNPLDDLLKRYEQELIAIQNRKEQAKKGLMN